MDKKTFWISAAAVIISFFGGFLLANALNRSELNTLRAETERLKNSPNASPQNNAELSLSDEEIRQKIAEADKNPDNFNFQKNLGLALYRYAAMKQDADLLSEVARLLTRANQKDEKDYDVLIALGNSYFDIGYIKKDDENLKKSREFYQKALAQKPNDADVRTDLGLTYFLVNPPETDKALAELNKSLQINAKHEKTLQVMTQALLSQNKTIEAEKYLTQLKEVNPKNQFLPELDLQFSQTKSGTPKQ
jgi:tetratricopeptide (TPR) repeat protein